MDPTCFQVDNLTLREINLQDNPLTIKTGSLKEQEIELASSMTFQNPLLLDTIIKYVVYKDNAKICRSTVGSVRLVAKNWLQSTSRVLKKLVDPVVHIRLGTENRVNQKYKEMETEQLLDNFVSLFNTEFCENSTLTFKFHISDDFDWKKHFLSLKNCLQLCGDSLLSLFLAIPENFGLDSIKCGPLNLPILQNLQLELCCVQQPSSLNQLPSTDLSKTSLTSLEFLQLILDGTKNLKIFKLTQGKNIGSKFADFRYVQLPATISSINSENRHFRYFYQLLMHNNLPNLQHLKLEIDPSPEEDLSIILDRFQTSLKSFSIGSNLLLKIPTKFTYLNFPLMKHLEKLSIDSDQIFMGPKMKCSLSTQFPKLRNFYMDGPSESNYSGWIENSRFENVNELGVFIGGEIFDYDSPSPFAMQKMKESFPNVTYLNFNLDFDNMSVLKILFRNWTQLKRLDLSFHGNVCTETTPNLLISNLLGISVTIVKEMENRYTKSAELPKHNFFCSFADSVFNLTWLSYLSLYTTDNSCDFKLDLFDRSMEMILHLTAFRIGLPNLQKIELLGAFDLNREDDSELDEDGSDEGEGDDSTSDEIGEEENIEIDIDHDDNENADDD